MTFKSGTPRKALRKTELRRGGRVKPVNRKRKAANWLRAYGSEERVQWFAAQPCVVSGEGPCENVHVRGDGMGRKAGYQSIVPMTAAHHRELHSLGLRSFEAKYHLDLAQLAEIYHALWLAETVPCFCAETSARNCPRHHQ
jgi:hypothetical protein